MEKLREKHVNFLKEKAGTLNEFLPLTKTSLSDLFHHLHQTSIIDITYAIGAKKHFDPTFS